MKAAYKIQDETRKLNNIRDAINRVNLKLRWLAIDIKHHHFAIAPPAAPLLEKKRQLLQERREVEQTLISLKE